MTKPNPMCHCGHELSSHHSYSDGRNACIGNRNLCSCKQFYDERDYQADRIESMKTPMERDNEEMGRK